MIIRSNFSIVTLVYIAEIIYEVFENRKLLGNYEGRSVETRVICTAVTSSP